MLYFSILMWFLEARVRVSHRFSSKCIRSITADEMIAQVRVAVMLQTCIMQVPGSYRGPDTDYPDLVVRGF